MIRFLSMSPTPLLRVFAPVVLLGATACGVTGDSSTEEELATPVAREIEVAADSLMRAMSAYLADEPLFAFTSDWLEEDVLDNSQKIQLGGTAHVLLERPGKLRLDLAGDERTQSLVYDGTVFAAHDPEEGVYAMVEFEGAIDELVDHLADEFGIVMPLADFMFSSPYESLVAEGTGGMYVGLHTVEGTACHHLAFMTDTVDWQIWIDAGAHPLPCKVVITYVDWEGGPQFSAVFRDWDLSPDVPADAFAFVPPEGAERIEFYQAPASEDPQ